MGLRSKVLISHHQLSLNPLDRIDSAGRRTGRTMKPSAKRAAAEMELSHGQQQRNPLSAMLAVEGVHGQPAAETPEARAQQAGSSKVAWPRRE